MTFARTFAAVCLAACLPLAATAQTFSFSFFGQGVSGSLSFDYGPATDAKYAGAFEITRISGVFSDDNNGLGIDQIPVTALVPISYDQPEATNLLAPHDFSHFAVASGLDHGVLSFDNLYWPGGSPQTATDYPVQGGFLDIYGVLFRLGDGRVVNVWSNGVFGPTGSPADYGVAVVSADQVFDYVPGGLVVAAVPEPSVLGFLPAGLATLAAATRRRRAKSSLSA